VYAKSLINNSYVGILPLNFIKLIDIPESISANPHTPANSTSILYLAVADFNQIEQGDLDFKKGDLVVGVRSVDENWSHGYNKNEKFGIFPMTHVIKINLSNAASAAQVISTPSVVINKEPQMPSQMVNEKVAPQTVDSPAANQNKDVNFNLKQAKAIHNFDNTTYSNDSSYNYMKLTAGDYLLITKKLDDNWLLGENSSGDKGLFPLNCVQLTQGKQHY
jgi:hypothetical protein